MKIALITISTGKIYRGYARNMFRSARQFFPRHDAFVFTDEPSAFVHQTAFYTEPKGFPQETLMRYHTMLAAEDLFKNYDQIFYLDSDMEIVAPVGEEIFSDGLTATLHPGYVGEKGTPETRLGSVAFTYNNSAYYCGGFQGGCSYRYLSAMKTLAQGISADEKNGITAVWHDESHWNSYLTHFEKPRNILDPSYCYPENAGAHYLDKWKAAGINPTPKIVALEKGSR